MGKKSWISSLRKSMSEHTFLWFAFLIILGKQLLTARIPIYIIPNNVYDDQLMVKLSESLVRGHWLGSYNQNTLVKGVFFPALLACIKALGLTYTSVMTLIYSLSCLLFVYVIKDLFKAKFVPYIIFVVLVLNPVSFAEWTFQRVYRNGITMAQALIIFACFFAIYLRREKCAKSLIGWAVGAGAAIFSLWNTREDGIWIMPFVIVVTIVLIGCVIYYSYRDYKGNYQGKESRLSCLLHSFNKKCNLKIVVMILPLIVFFIGNQVISVFNYACYGIYATNELNQSHFNDVMKSIYAVKPNEEIQYVSVTREKLDRIYEVSPTLNSIHDYMEASMDAWANNDRTSGDGEVEDGWFFWALRGAVYDAGLYTDAKSVDSFYEKVSNEIETALDEGKLERQPTMPSALMSPWREGYEEQLAEAFVDCVDLTTGFTDVITTQNVSFDNGSGEIHLYESMTNNTSLHDMVEVIGWYFAKDGRAVNIQIVDEDGTVYANPEMNDSEDVYSCFENTEYVNDAAKKSRFLVSVKNYVPKAKESLLTAQVIDAATGEVYDSFLLDRVKSGVHTDKGVYGIEKLTSFDNMFNVSRGSVKACNAITSVYKVLGQPLMIAGVVSYIVITICLIISLVNKKAKKNRKDYTTVWLFLTAMLLTMVVLIGGVSYNHIASCNSIFYMYLSGVYPLILGFWSMALLYVIDRIPWNMLNGKNDSRKKQKSQ